jgi:hypothetical protein
MNILDQFAIAYTGALSALAYDNGTQIVSRLSKEAGKIDDEP